MDMFETVERLVSEGMGINASNSIVRLRGRLLPPNATLDHVVNPGDTIWVTERHQLLGGSNLLSPTRYRQLNDEDNNDNDNDYQRANSGASSGIQNLLARQVSVRLRENV